MKLLQSPLIMPRFNVSLRSLRTLRFSILSGLFFLYSCSTPSVKPEPPEPFGALPSPQQVDWQHMEFYAFVHFNMNTFTNIEWGTGGESPELFNPTELDCRQWARICKKAGMKGIILTAKHHDGFCLWDSEYTEHDVANSPWKEGRGDVVRELADACQEYGLKLGIYYSPWDRNHPDYGQPEYIEYFRNQLTELLTNYGDVFEVWFDGANGGTGYYGGANEERRVDRQSYYNWPEQIALVRSLQPNAVIFSDAGPDVRWVGTEKGFANPTNWSTLNRDNYYPGTPDYVELRSGNKNGTHWVPAEVNTSIRPGWYYHPEQDTAVKSIDHLELIYYHSIGRNGTFLLNLPVDTRGLVHENDSVALIQLRERIDHTFKPDIRSSTSVVTVPDPPYQEYASNFMLDGDLNTYWAPINLDDFQGLEIKIEFKSPQTFNVFEIREYIPLGQRVEGFSMYTWNTSKNDWDAPIKGTTIGNRRWLNLDKVETSKVKLVIDSSMATPLISEIGFYYRPHQNPLLESGLEMEALGF